MLYGRRSCGILAASRICCCGCSFARRDEPRCRALSGNVDSRDIGDPCWHSTGIADAGTDLPCSIRRICQHSCLLVAAIRSRRMYSSEVLFQVIGVRLFDQHCLLSSQSAGPWAHLPASVVAPDLMLKCVHASQCLYWSVLRDWQGVLVCAEAALGS